MDGKRIMTSIRQLWISPKSWLLGPNGVLSRPGSLTHCLGLGREGLEHSMALSCVSTTKPRQMYELFTNTGYAILDNESTVISLEGPLSTKDIVTEEAWRKKLTIEEYVGKVVIPEWSVNFLEPAPHCDYLPISIAHRVMKEALGRTGQEPFVVQRPLFPSAHWLLKYIFKAWECAIEIEVDNKTYPSGINFLPREPKACHVLAASTFIEPNPILLEVEQAGWHLVCDGLIIG